MSPIGLLFGFILGLSLQQSHLNFAKELHLTSLRKQIHTLIILLLIILTQSIILFILVAIQLVTLPPLPNYSLIAVIIGSFIFGVGMIFAQGCILDNLVQIGTLRLSSLVTLIVFIMTLVAYNLGTFTSNFTALESKKLISDNLIRKLPFPPLFLVSLLFFITIICAWLNFKKEKTISSINNQENDSSSWLTNTSITAILIGILAGLAFEANSLNHSFGGFSIVSPLLSWYGFLKGNGAGIQLSWGMYFILGIIIGSFTYAFKKKRFNLMLNLSELIGAIFGGILMGLGAGLSKGTFTSNGLVYTAILSTQGWLALLFTIIGCWSASFVLYIVKKV